MKILVGAVAVALLVGGLAGCRSRRRAQAAAPSTSIAAQPAPRVTYPSRGPSVAPSTYPSYPSTATRVVRPAPTTTARVVRNIPTAIGPSMAGSPDAMDMGAPTFPPAQPGAYAPAPSMPAGVPVIAGGARTSAEVDAEIARLSSRLRQMEQDMVQRPVIEEESSTGLAAANQDGRAADFADKLRGRCNGGEVFQEGNVVIVRLTDAFQSGSDMLKKSPALVTTLLNTANALSGAGAQEVLVVGHTDSDPISKSKWPSNKALSEARAQRVAQELSKRGVPACDLEVMGEGATQPLVDGKGKAAKAKNRRVEVHVRF